MADFHFTPDEPVCPDCGADCSPLLAGIDTARLDWRDDEERRLGDNALAIQQHRHTVHPVRPQVGDVVIYWSPWRSMIIGNGPLRVMSVRDGVWPPGEAGQHYWLADPDRPKRTASWYWPFAGGGECPITFEIVEQYVPQLPEPSLFNLLGDEWTEDMGRDE